MIGVTPNPSSIQIPVIQNGCLKYEFDSSYPVHLNGIISQAEYLQSIKRINESISSNKSLLLITVAFILFIVIGFIFFIVGGITIVNYRGRGISPFIIVGIIVAGMGPLLIGVSCFLVQSRRAANLRRVIAEESSKYSTRSPIPCSWRLDTTRVWFGGYGNYNNRVVYHLVIDIGRSNSSQTMNYYGNQVAPTQYPAFVGQHNIYSQPPPYSELSTNICPQCGAQRHDAGARFCSSCGQSYNKY